MWYDRYQIMSAAFELKAARQELQDLLSRGNEGLASEAELKRLQAEVDGLEAAVAASTAAVSVQGLLGTIRGWFSGSQPSGSAGAPTEHAPTTREGVPWGRWEDYPKVKMNGKEYAQVGDRLYTAHAVERMRPGGTAPSASAPTEKLSTNRKAPYEGRGISPEWVEEVIANPQSRSYHYSDEGVLRTQSRSGSVTVVTEAETGVVITIIGD